LIVEINIYKLASWVGKRGFHRGYDMETSSEQLEIQGVPAYVASWSAASIPGFVPAVLDRWQRNYGKLPGRFIMVMCPKVEVNAVGGLPAGVIQRTNPRLRLQHFTGCHKPYLVLFYAGDDAEEWRRAVQGLLSWSEAYVAESRDGMMQLRFVEAVEELD
jgi:hypothetical protein